MTRIGNEQTDIDRGNPHVNVTGVTPSSTTGQADTGHRQTTVTLSVLPEHSMVSTANDVYDIARTRVRRAATADSNAGATTLPVSTLLAQLLQSQAQITGLLQRQPDFQHTTATSFQTALDATFLATSQTIDPNHIYITSYVNEVINLAGDNPISQRRPLSCLTLNQALEAALTTGQVPDYDAGSTGFFQTPGNAINNPDQVVQGMDGAEHVSAFVQILQNMAQQRTTSYQQSLNHFWNTPDADDPTQQTPKAQLITAYRLQRQAEATLRFSDGTLSSAGKQLLDKAYTEHPQTTGDNALNRPGLFSLHLYTGAPATPMPLPGMFLVTRHHDEPPDATSGPVLMVIPGQGLMEFKTASICKETLQNWLDDPDQRTLLLNHADRAEHSTDPRRPPGQNHPFGFSALTLPLFPDRFQSLLDQQQRNISHVFGSSQVQHRALLARLEEAVDLQHNFTRTDIEETRSQLLAEKFLERAGNEDRKSWFDELAQFQRALQATQSSGLPSIRQYLDPVFLKQYASNSIQEKLERDLQLTLDPDNIMITTSELVSYSYPTPLPTIMSYQTSTRTLTTLALENTTALDNAHRDKVSVIDTDGYPVPQLTHACLKDLVRTLNIGQRYKELLQSHLLDSPEGLARELQYMRFLKAQLQLDARETNIAGDMSSEHMRWIHAVISSGDVQSNGKPIQARQLRIHDKLVNGILLFATQRPLLNKDWWRLHPISQSSRLTPGADPDAPLTGTGVPQLLMFTPDAPDGKRLRSFADRDAMLAHFINNPAMHNYLLSHIDMQQQSDIAARLKKKISPGDISDTAISGNFLRTFYRTQAAQIIANADASSTTNDEVDRQARRDTLNTAFDIAGILLPAKATMPISLARATHAFFNAGNAMQSDNQEEALSELIGGLAHLGEVAADGMPAHRKLRANQPPSRPVTAPSTAASERVSHGPSMTKKPSVSASPTPSSPPTGMTAVDIDGKTYYYWQSAANPLAYRDLFMPDPAHPGQIRAAGYGVPDANNTWRRISLRGGGPGQLPHHVKSMKTVSADAETSRVVQRIAAPIENAHYFSAKIAGNVRRLMYNFQDHTFFDPTTLDSKRYLPRYNEMMPLHSKTRRTATDAQREGTLKALGINLTLPLELNPPAANAKPIPRTIHSVWVGGEIPASRRMAILTSLQNNALKARSGDHPYEMKLYLSNRNPQAYAANLRHLREGAPDVPIVVLEDAPFYKAFSESKYFRAYEAAIDGNGGVANNYSSASDVLRYRLLHHEGGIYMDCDDTLTSSPGSIEIKTTVSGLALDDPVSNTLLGMDMQYNTSIFGTHKRNPTLNAISERIHQRFLQNQDLYQTQRPRRFTHAQRRAATHAQNIANEEKLYAYMQRISYVTGPNVFNKVIDDQLPEMRQVREAVKMKAHFWNFRLSSNTKNEIATWAESHLPLGQINRMGNAHTWDETRR